MHKYTVLWDAEFQSGTSLERFAPCTQGEAWTPEEIASMLPNAIKQEPNPFIDDLERRMKEMEVGDNSGE